MGSLPGITVGTGATEDTALRTAVGSTIILTTSWRNADRYKMYFELMREAVDTANQRDVMVMLVVGGSEEVKLKRVEVTRRRQQQQEQVSMVGRTGAWSLELAPILFFQSS